MSKYTPGDWHVICDVCGKKTRASDIKRRWDGLLVCPHDHEHRHPQDFLKAKTDKISVPFSRNQPEDTFTHTCDIATRSSYADLGTADCAMVDYLPDSYLNLLDQFVCSIDDQRGVAGVAAAGCARPMNNLIGYL